MEYKLQTKDKTIAVDLTLDQENRMTATIEKIGHDPINYDQVRYGRVSDHQVQLVVNGQQINAWIENQADGKTILLNGERFFIQDTDKLAQTQTRKTGPDQGSQEVTPPMPAVVICVSVQPGDVVKKGDVVVVVSAMKMETSLTAPHAGTITRVGVAEGDKVMPGDILVDIEKTDTSET
ncbi:MAG: biotin/lipoyl-binding protein [Proteobacteria bacterium]|nr:biotin/lipoyl-binding protein [Desulfobacula sp.]MBU3950746.1 biotin/lipoyl-binding protein [Pseudomonadota bacterium]MBU4131337.1 biotin/lipoyl-binding protein [Pseudomonadota bacterium]